MRGRHFETVIFDLDGTLIDTARDVHACSNITLERMGIRTISLEEAKLSIGPGSDNFARITLGERDMFRFEEFITLYREIYQHKCLVHSKPFPGIVDVLDKLNNRNLLVATNKPLVYSEKILAELDVLRYFRSVLGPEDVRHQKPYPDMVELGIRRVNGSAATTLMIGDTDNDIEAAKRAGVHTCAVTWGYGPLEVLEKLNPDYIINNADEIPAIVNGRE